MAYTTINRSSDYFRTKTYSGNGTNNTNITFDETTNMQPDFVWIKNRSQGATGGYHRICDAIRGAGYEIFTNDTGAEAYSNNVLKAFQTNGFQLGTDSAVNNASYTYVSWNFKANGAGISNTQGSITSTVSANTTSGFSIVSYTGNGTSGATVGHGLGVAPAFTIVKNRSMAGRNFQGFHQSLGNTKSHLLNSTEVPRTNVVFWNNTSPTSTLITLGNDADVNESGKSFIAYCFAEVKGFSKFGSWISNGSATADAFVYTGFKPAWVMMKMSTSSSSWFIYDNKRVPYNPSNAHLIANYSDAEGTNTSVDFYSNGFRSNGLFNSYSGQTIIYAAFAEQPLVGTNNVPATAR